MLDCGYGGIVGMERKLYPRFLRYGYDRFEEIMGIDNIYAESTIALAKAWRQRHPDERVMFIGDTTHDYETAEVLGADCYLISAGHQPEYKLASAGEGVKIFPCLEKLVEYLKTK